MADELSVEIGTSAEEMGRRLVAAWEAAERGEHVVLRRRLIFDSAESLLACVATTEGIGTGSLTDSELKAARRAAAMLE